MRVAPIGAHRRSIVADDITLLTTTHLLEALRDPANQKMWSVLDGRYRPVLFGVAIKQGLSAEDAADIAQESLADVVAGYREGRFDRSRGRLRTWIMTIGRRRLTDVLRVKYRRGEVGAQRRGDSAFDAIPADAEIDEAWQQEEQKELLREAIDWILADESTAPLSREVFEKVCVRGLEESVAASECGISVDRIYVIKSRMVTRLRERVEALQEAREISEG
jgi:RNA polymerase sigma-70 factor (ECF subfamily)